MSISMFFLNSQKFSDFFVGLSESNELCIKASNTVGWFSRIFVFDLAPKKSSLVGPKQTELVN